MGLGLQRSAFVLQAGGDLSIRFVSILVCLSIYPLKPSISAKFGHLSFGLEFG